jgi:hypothetical protein
MSGSARWLMPRAVCHVAASGLRLSGELECMHIGPDHTRPGLDMCQLWTPIWALIKARVCSILEPWDPTVGGPDPIRGGPDPILGVRSVHVGVLDQHGGPNCISRGPRPTWRSRLYIQGSWTNLEVRTVYPGVQNFPMGVRTHC